MAAFGVAAYFWPLVDDAPVNLDATLNGYAWGHLFLELLFKVLMAAFALLAIREAARASPRGSFPRGAVWLLALLAFLLAQFDDFALAIGPLHFAWQGEIWDPANALTKGASIACFLLALHLARGPRESGVFKTG